MEVKKLKINLGSLLDNPGYKDAEEFRSLWKKAVELDESEHSNAVSLKDGKLTVCVDNSVYLQNFLLKRMDILRRINDVSPGRKISEICFKLGSAA